MALCVICGKQINNAKRSTRHYCSGACRSKADRSRKRAMKAAQALTFTIWENHDLNEIKKRSLAAYNSLQKLYARLPREFSELALNAVMDLMFDADLCSSEYWELVDHDRKVNP